MFLRVHRSLASFRREAKFSSWLYRITFNEALNAKARTRYRAPHISYQALKEQSSPDANPLDAIPDPILADCLVRLPEVYQSALRLHYWMDYSVAEISNLLGVPQNTVKSYLHRARIQLRALLEQKGFRDV